MKNARLSIALAAVALGVVGAYAADEIRVGIVGLDTGHPMLFTEMVNVKKPAAAKGFRVTAAYPWGSRSIATSVARYPANLEKIRAWGVEVVPTIAELLAKCDAVMLETSDGREHYAQAREIFASGKPVYVDKPFAASLADVVRIVELGKRFKTKYFATSSVRYMQGCEAARRGEMGKVRGAVVWSQEAFEPTHSDYFWYAIHGAEPLFTIMGRGCEKVSALAGPDGDTLTGLWKDGRQGVMHGMRWTKEGSGYGGIVFTETKKGAVKLGCYAGFDPLSAEIMKFFRTGVVPVDPAETLEIYTFLEAAAQSKKQGGAPVALADVLAAARREAAALDGRSEGWDNHGSKRRLLVPRKPVWTAKIEDGAFDVKKIDGAEGTVRVEKGALVVDKTNGRGRICVTFKDAFRSDKGRRLRLSAQVECTNAPPLESGANLRLFAGGRDRGPTRLDQAQWGGGRPRNEYAVNTAPGVLEWKYAHGETSPENGLDATARIVVSGAPATTVWRNVAIEDYDEVCRAWGWLRDKYRHADYSGDRVDEATFDRALAADVDHVARIATVNGQSQLLVDGRPVPPVIYKSDPPDVYTGFRCVNAGKRMDATGVRLQSPCIPLGASFRSPRACWSRAGVNVSNAVAALRNDMRIAPNSLFIVNFNLDPYEEFAEDHPDEAWRGRNGEVVYGTPGAVRGACRPGEPLPKRCRPWTSMSSLVWREEVKKVLSAIIAEFRRTGLAKRIVGVHLSGFHDCQFAVSDWPDFSPAALASYRRHTGNPQAQIPEYFSGAERVLDPVKDAERIAWLDFIHREPCRVLNDVARHVKACFGKEIVTVRWCMGAFTGQYASSYDIGEFTESDALDVLVAQAVYGNRAPAIPLGCKLPLASFNAHRKLYVNEFDFRTWNAFDSCMTSDVSCMGLGCFTDFPSWQAGYRRAAGQMFANGMGFWLLDMGGGWFDDAQIAADVADSFVGARAAAKDGGAWHPSAAVVIDERSVFRRNLLSPIPGKPHVWRAGGSADLNDHLPKFAASGVPLDYVLAEDVLRDPTLAARYRALAWTCLPAPDAVRQKFFDDFRKRGGRLLLPADLATTTARSFHAFAQEAGAYVPMDRAGVQVDMNGAFASLHCLVPGRYAFKLPHPCRVTNLKTGADVDATNGVLPLDLVAGETRWYAFTR